MALSWVFHRRSTSAARHLRQRRSVFAAQRLSIMVQWVIDGAPCRRCQLENDPRTALLSQDQFHRFHLRTQPRLWKLVAHRLPNDHDRKLSLGGHDRNRRRQCLIRGGDACGLTGCPKTDAVRPLAIDDPVHPSRQPRSVTLSIDWGIPTSASCFLNSASVTRSGPEQPDRSRARRRGVSRFMTCSAG